MYIRRNLGETEVSADHGGRQLTISGIRESRQSRIRGGQHPQEGVSLGKAGSKAVENTRDAVVLAEQGLKELTISGRQGPRQLAIWGKHAAISGV